MWDSWFKKEQKWWFRNPENSPFYSKLWPKYTMLDNLMLTRGKSNHFSTRIWRKNRNIPKNVFWCFSRGTYPLNNNVIQWDNFALFLIWFSPSKIVFVCLSRTWAEHSQDHPSGWEACVLQPFRATRAPQFRLRQASVCRSHMHAGYLPVSGPLDFRLVIQVL